MRPDFLVIGAPKAATTSLCYLLDQHPQVGISKPKETFFFSHDHVYAKGWEWYEKLFPCEEEHLIRGEGTTVYSQMDTYPNALSRIVKHLPDAKIIYIVRNPLERIESYWIELLSQGLTMLPFCEAVRTDWQYVESSLYWKQISGYRQHYPDNKILLLFYEEFAKDSKMVMRKCYEFLGVETTVDMSRIQQKRYVSEGKRSDRRITNILRRTVPGFSTIRNATPLWVKKVASKLMKREIVGRPEWEDEVRLWVIEQVCEDSQRFLKHCGKPIDYWRLET